MKNIDVAVAVIKKGLNSAEHQYLIAKRDASQHQGNKWEFPGGKVEADETITQALARELKEELDIQINDSLPLLKIQHQYPDKLVTLHVHEVIEWEGTALNFQSDASSDSGAVGNEGQLLMWVKHESLPTIDFPEANGIIVECLLNGDYCLATPELETIEEEMFLSKLAQASNNNIHLIYLRQKALTPEQYTELLFKIFDHNISFVRLLIDYEKIAFDALDDAQKKVLIMKLEQGLVTAHLTSYQLALAVKDKPVYAKYIKSASCHNLKELRLAEQMDCEFVFLSPVKMTNSHTDAFALSEGEFECLCQQTKLQVYGLGGLEQNDVFDMRKKGARGIAAISAFWSVLKSS